MPDGDLATAVARRMVSAVLKSLSPHVMQWNYGRRVCVRCGQSDDGPCRPLVTKRDVEAVSKSQETSVTPEQRECTNPLHEAPDGSLVCPVCGLLIEKTIKKRLVAIMDEWEADPRPAKKRTRN